MDFANFNKKDIANLDVNDPILIQNCQLELLPSINQQLQMTAGAIRSFYMKNLIMNAIIANQQQTLLNLLKVNTNNKQNIIFDTAFSNLQKEDIDNLDLTDPLLIQSCQFQLLPSIDVLLTMSKIDIRTLYVRNMIICKIVNSQQRTLLNLLRLNTNNNDDPLE